MSSPRRVSAAVLLVSAIAVRAQGPAGEIAGSVTDATGSVVSGATITITNPTNKQRIVSKRLRNPS